MAPTLAPTLARQESEAPAAEEENKEDYVAKPVAKLATKEPQLGEAVQIEVQDTAEGPPEGTTWEWGLGELDESVLAPITDDLSGESATLEADPVAPGSTSVTPQLKLGQPAGSQSPPVPSVAVVIPEPTATFEKISFTPCAEGGTDPRSAEALKVGDSVSWSVTVDKAGDTPDAVVDAEVKVSGASTMSPAVKFSGKTGSLEWLVPNPGDYDVEFTVKRHDGEEVGKSSQKLKATMGKVGPKVLKAWEQELDDHQGYASGAAKTIAADGDACVKSLKSAKDHMKTVNENYEQAHKRVTDLLAKASIHQAVNDAIVGAVQDALIGAVLGPVKEAHIAAAKLSESGKALLDHANALASAGLAVAKAGGAVPSDGGGDKKASEAGNAGGTKPGEQLKSMMSTLDAMISALPEYGRQGQVATSSAEAAGKLSKAAAVGAAGGTGEFTPDQVGEKKPVVMRGRAAVDASRASVAGAKASMGQMAASATAQEVKSVDDVEKELWNGWVASLKSRREKDAMDLDVVEAHLIKLGVIPDYGYLSNADEDDAVKRARKKLLQDRGITPPDDDGKLECFYNRELKRDEVKARVVGQAGTTTSTADSVVVGGSPWSLATIMSGKTDVIITGVAPKPHLADAAQLNWADSDFTLTAKRAGEEGGY